MSRTLPRAEVKVEDDGQTVHLRLCREEALALAEAIRFYKLQKGRFNAAGGERLGGIARRIIAQTRPKPKHRREHHPYRVDRPPNQYRSEIDRDSVVNGPAPYPVLCEMDMRTVYLVLCKRGKSVPEIAERLHLTQRTIFRWRKKPPSWMETHDRETDPAG